LNGVIYTPTTTDIFGKGLFINAKDDLQEAIPIGEGSKLGAREDSVEKADLKNLMGYDNYDL
jgi:hypothetical protein